jgi:hypothetical protein
VTGARTDGADGGAGSPRPASRGLSLRIGTPPAGAAAPAAVAARARAAAPAPVAAPAPGPPIPGAGLGPVFAATGGRIEKDVLNAQWCARHVSGRDGRTVRAVPHDAALELLAAHRRPER